eukprot:ANDGO_03211.mRNA.1 hypothetical protein DICPUDRAFT_155043
MVEMRRRDGGSRSGIWTTLLLQTVVLFGMCGVSLGVKLAKVHVVDYVQRPDRAYNILFRGDMPRNDSVPMQDCGFSQPLWMCFGYTELREFMTIKAANETHIPLPASFYLTDLSLLSGMQIIEDTDLKIENSYFFQFPERGRLHHWPFYGSASCPNQYSATDQEAKARTFSDWDLDLLHNRTQQMYDMLHATTSDTPTVLYWHCEHGMDRSGEMGIAYQMRYLGWSWTKAKQYADHVGNRPIQRENACNAQWYCLFLQYALGFKDLQCLGST